eukprot:406095_1
MYEARVHPVIYRCCQQLNGCQYSQPFEKKNVSVGEIQMLQQSLPFNSCVAYAEQAMVVYWKFSCNAAGDIVTVQSYGTDSTCNETNGNPDTGTFTASNASFECNVVDYYAVFNLSSSICAKNRDPFTPLCARCKPGTYELFGTTSCGNCNKWINILWIIPILIA